MGETLSKQPGHGPSEVSKTNAEAHVKIAFSN